VTVSSRGDPRAQNDHELEALLERADDRGGNRRRDYVSGLTLEIKGPVREWLGAARHRPGVRGY